MALSTSEFISTLNNLIETLKDGQEGFQQAAEGVQNPNLRSVFQQYAQQRAQFATELQQQVAQLGKQPESTGSVAGSIHRGWINLKSAITGKDDHAILAECERGEDDAVRNYRDALAQDLPSDLKSIIQQQYTAVQQAHNHVRSLRDSTK